MVEDKKTDGAVFVGLSIRMVVKGEEQNEEGEADDQTESDVARLPPRRIPPDLIFPPFQGVSPVGSGITRLAPRLSF
jgi:hypothetical protein